MFPIEPSTVSTSLFLENSEGDAYLSDALIKSSGIGCKYGKRGGDKVFVKNLAVNLFGKCLLLNSSTSERKPTTGENVSRPALPQAGILYIHELFKKKGFTRNECRNHGKRAKSDYD